MQEFSINSTIIISIVIVINMCVSKNWGTPKWMVYNGKPYV